MRNATFQTILRFRSRRQLMVFVCSTEEVHLPCLYVPRWLLQIREQILLTRGELLANKFAPESTDHLSS